MLTLKFAQPFGTIQACVDRCASEPYEGDWFTFAQSGNQAVDFEWTHVVGQEIDGQLNDGKEIDGEGVGEGDSGEGKSGQENANVVMAGVAGEEGEEEPEERTYRCPKCGKGMKCIAFSFRGSWKDIMQGKYRPHWYP